MGIFLSSVIFNLICFADHVAFMSAHQKNKIKNCWGSGGTMLFLTMEIHLKYSFLYLLENLLVLCIHSCKIYHGFPHKLLKSYSDRRSGNIYIYFSPTDI